MNHNDKTEVNQNAAWELFAGSARALPRGAVGIQAGLAGAAGVHELCLVHYLLESQRW